MKLDWIKRNADKKSEVKRLRREGYIPAAVYAKGQETETVAVKSTDFNTLVRQLTPGRLPTTIFTLVDGNGKERRAIIKDIQYNVVTYDVIHLDFDELVPGQKINVKVPIECTGVVDCVGIKLGGVLRQVIRGIRVRCLPQDIPAFFEMNVKDLALFQSKRLADLEIPNTIRPLDNLKEVAVAIVKR
jgi:large subunit ribosomal protein L25